MRVKLAEHGLPKDFFTLASTDCASQIIAYRFVVWLNEQTVAVGFSTSPRCRTSATVPVAGMARVLSFDIGGELKAQRDIPYLADGFGELVADGEAKPGPGNTLLFGFQSVNLDQSGAHESKSGSWLLDENLKLVAQFDGAVEETTLIQHALVFQQGFTTSGPRTYSVVAGLPPMEIAHWSIDWPVGSLDRKFGERGFAFMLCKQELRPGSYSNSSIIYAGAKKRCSLEVKAKDDRQDWEVPLIDGQTAAILGVLSDDSIALQVSGAGANRDALMLVRKDHSKESLPWAPGNFNGSLQGSTATLSRYALLATEQSWLCRHLGRDCDSQPFWMVLDRSSANPIAKRALADNERVALSPDGTHYATFEAGELRIYDLPQVKPIAASLR